MSFSKKTVAVKERTSPERAKEYAFLLLKYRLRSEHELASRLRKKKFSAETIERTISFLKEKKFIDDEIFSRQWVAGRVAGRIGPFRIARELRLKGIEPSLIKQRLQELAEGAAEENQAVESLVEQKYRQLKTLDARTAKRRLYAFLMRRGFDADTVADAINRRFKDT